MLGDSRMRQAHKQWKSVETCAGPEAQLAAVA